ncbi:hypothetical protein DFH07DRAFT_780370 [Mycena maculata]|uniref:Uncharacterized protein n=1 Tax=Mycena maculata TaxID=230809 RepID=A0AAD7I3I2_9AGAR|nr:hypothetical protein DFH07DRAFT_780370 [Mycena maculata]
MTQLLASVVDVNTIAWRTQGRSGDDRQERGSIVTKHLGHPTPPFHSRSSAFGAYRGYNREKSPPIRVIYPPVESPMMATSGHWQPLIDIARQWDPRTAGNSGKHQEGGNMNSQWDPLMGMGYSGNEWLIQDIAGPVKYGGIQCIVMERGQIFSAQQPPVTVLKSQWGGYSGNQCTTVVSQAIVEPMKYNGVQRSAMEKDGAQWQMRPCIVHCWWILMGTPLWSTEVQQKWVGDHWLLMPTNADRREFPPPRILLAHPIKDPRHCHPAAGDPDQCGSTRRRHIRRRLERTLNLSSLFGWTHPMAIVVEIELVRLSTFFLVYVKFSIPPKSYLTCLGEALTEYFFPSLWYPLKCPAERGPLKNQPKCLSAEIFNSDKNCTQNGKCLPGIG